MNYKKLLAKVAMAADVEMRDPPYIILIGGGRGSGKTTIARGLVSELKNGKGLVVDMNDFYFEDDRMKERGISGNYDHPRAVDMTNLGRFLRMLKNGNMAEKPIYDIETHKIFSSEEIEPKTWIFVDGLFALHHRIRRYSDVRLFVSCRERTMLQRRVRVDGLEGSIDRYFFEKTLPMHRKCVLPTKKYAQITVDGER